MSKGRTRLQQLASEIFHEQGTTSEAVESLVASVLGESVTYNEDTEEVELAEDSALHYLIYQAAEMELFAVRRHSRRVIEKKSPTFVPKVYTDEFKEKTTYAVSRFLNWELASGIRLQFATRAEITEQIGIHRAQTLGAFVRMTFLRKVRSLLRDDQTIDTLYKNKNAADRKLAALYREAEQEGCKAFPSEAVNV